MLLLASEEYHHFIAFSKWLRYAIDVQSADPASTTGEEGMERDPGIDYLSALSYIRHAMERSRISQFLSDSGSNPHHIESNPNMYDDLKEALKLSDEAKSNKGDLLKISAYYAQCRVHNKTLVEQITSWQRKTTIIPGGLVLADGQLSHYDMRMVSEVCWS
jgi:anaphase-promoting complex subunit 4